MTGHILKRIRDLEPFYRSGSFVVQGKRWVKTITLPCGMRAMIDDPTANEPEDVNAYAVTAKDGYTFYLSLRDLNCTLQQWTDFLAYMRGDTDA